MKKIFLISILLILVFSLCFVFSSCDLGNDVIDINDDEQKEEEINNDREDDKGDKEDETVKEKTTVSDYEDDYIGILNAYLDNYYNKINSIRYTEEGVVSAKVLFIDYDSEFGSTNIKKSNCFYSKSYSHSSIVNFDSIKYETKTMVTESNDLENFSVYTVDDYNQKNYSAFLPLLHGYICSDDTIVKASLVSNTNGQYRIKYEFDVDKSTKYLKQALMDSGELSELPTFISSIVTLTIKNDFTPVKCLIEAKYVARKPFIGKTTVTQQSEINYSNINQELTIPNEPKFIELVGMDPYEVVEEVTLEEELVNSVLNMPWNEGQAIKGAITSELFKGFGYDFRINGELQALLDPNKVTEDSGYDFGNAYGRIEITESTASLISLLFSFAGDSIPFDITEYEDLRLLDIYYIGDGYIYLEFIDKDNNSYQIKRVELNSLVEKYLSGDSENEDSGLMNIDKSKYTLEKEVIDDTTYRINIIIDELVINDIRAKINEMLEQQSFVKSLLGYKDLGEVEAYVTIIDGKFDSIYLLANYYTTNNEVKDFLRIDFKVLEFDHDFTNDSSIIDRYQFVDQAYEVSVLIDELLDNFDFEPSFKEQGQLVIDKYEALPDGAKKFVTGNITTLKNLVNNYDKELEIYTLLKNELSDIDNLTNEDIYNCVVAGSSSIDISFIKTKLGEDLANKYDSITDYVNYGNLSQDIKKASSSSSVDSWGWTKEQIKEYKLIFQIASKNDSVRNKIVSFMGITGFFSYNSIAKKILNYEIVD